MNLWNLYITLGNSYTDKLCSLSFRKTKVKNNFIETSNAMKFFKMPKPS